MKVVTGQQMKAIDTYTIEELGIPGIVLMERAALAVSKAAREYLQDIQSPKVGIFCGKGNNGGDGFAIARILVSQGYDVEVFLVGRREDITGDARINLAILSKLNLEVEEIINDNQIIKIKEKVKDIDLIIDALLGTGIKGELRGLYPKIIRLISLFKKYVIAVDIPSGVEADTAKYIDLAIRADQTITFANPKLGNLLYPGAEFNGRVKVVDIGIPQESIEQQQINVNLIDNNLVKKLLPNRRDNSHKGDYGKVLIVAGSIGMSGAATLTAEASLKMGAGLVTVAAPPSINSILEMKLTEAMTYPLAGDEEGVITKSSLADIKDLLAERDLLTIGPGLGQSEEINQIIKELILTIDKPLIIDADGLNAIKDVDILKERRYPLILTPHPGEMARLINKSIKEVTTNPIAVATNFASKYQVNLVLKGSRTIVAMPTGEAYINIIGNSGMATGGSGDVLTGLITALFAQGINPNDATIIAVYLHALAGDLAAEELTKYSLLPSDLIKYLPQGIRAVKSSEEQ